MNLLAHAYLSGDNTQILVGNLIGDFVKGKRYEQYEGDLQKGILLHRQIDEYTDTHPIVIQSKRRLSEKYRHYSGVIVDLFYDYFLASQWQKHHHTSLEQFSAQVYESLKTLSEHIPKKANEMFGYMERGNWLLNYREVKGIDSALTGLSHRTKFLSKMEQAADDLVASKEEFKEEFDEFFPQIKAFTEEWMRHN
ncbi:ACP phosphodiesterase [Fulvivirga maritima]|uniref:acyl carrier protein phosphodiesterase n=1 Tax=Fulvivirga maritima TaxID=2904247 RepID=UPI001F38C82B|nr:ACP phosphodiesterase [Fulvivirga maritima]UII27093.1 ACP phosphodiesterase [Fulvivirga maritima]